MRPCGDSHEILLGERGDTHGFWQWPQGGCENSESEEDTLRRELAEEVGLTRYRVLYRFPFRLRYRFPLPGFDSMRPNLGQDQTYFIVTPLEEPSLEKAADDEFRALRWLPFEQTWQQWS